MCLPLHLLKVKVKVAQSCPTLCDPMDYTVHGILQARILEWVAFPFFRGSSQPGGLTQVSRNAGRFYQLSHKGSPRILEWVAYPFSSGASRPRDQPRVSCIAGEFFTNWAMREAPHLLKFTFKCYNFKEDLTYLWLNLLPARIFYRSLLLYFVCAIVYGYLSSLHCMLHENRNFPCAVHMYFQCPEMSGI